MKYVAVVVTYNRLQLLKKCIDNLVQQTKQIQKILIINNGSTKETFEYLVDKEEKNKNIRCIHLENNCGGSGGFYIGIKNALEEDSDFMILLDDDAILDKTFCEYMDEAIKDFPECKAFAGTVMKNGYIDTSHRLKRLSDLFSLYVRVPKYKYRQNYFECDFLSFCGTVIETKLIRKIGLPKKEYFIWYDDMEYSCRIRHFTPIINVSRAIVNHCQQEDDKMTMNWRLYYGVRNRFDMVKMHMGLIPLAFLYLRTFAIMIIKYFVYVMQRKDKYRYIARCYKDGMVDALKGVSGKSELYQKGGV